MTGSATEFIRETYRQPYRASILRKSRKENEVAFDGQVDPYTAFIWDLAAQFTHSTEEAEAAVHEMMVDIKRCTESDVCPQTAEDRLTTLIALRRLLKFLEKPGPDQAAEAVVATREYRDGSEGELRCRTS